MQQDQKSMGYVGYLIAAVACVGIMFPTYAKAELVKADLDNGEFLLLDRAVVNTCEEEGLDLGACACVVNIMLEKEGVSSLSVAQMTKLADTHRDAYNKARSHCKNDN